MTAIKAIETRYKGYRFRSRLEARWAVFFDSLGTEWEYEKEGFDLGEPLGRYLPDFYLPKFAAWAEVKPEIPGWESVEVRKLQTLVFSQPLPTMGIFLGQVGQTKMVARERDQGFWEDIDREIHHLNFDHTTNPGTLLCPICGYDFVHIQNSINIDGKDSYAGGRGVRGSVIVIPMWCENDHSWEVDFGFHKGQTYLSVRNIKERLTDFALILASGDYALLENAVTQAKSARFEHGESPSIPRRRGDFLRDPLEEERFNWVINKER